MGLERHEGEKWQFSFLREPLTDTCLGGKTLLKIMMICLRSVHKKGLVSTNTARFRIATALPLMGFSKGGGAVRKMSRERGVGLNQWSGGGRDDLEVEVYMLQTGQQCCETVQQHLVHRAPWLQETQSHPYGDGSKVTPLSSLSSSLCSVLMCTQLYTMQSLLSLLL